MDSFKYAATLNEWETWARHHEQLSSCANLVKLHGYTKADGKIKIYSEFCSGGDVQSMIIRNLSSVSGAALASTSATPSSVPPATTVAAGESGGVLQSSPAIGPSGNRGNRGLEEGLVRRISTDVLRGLSTIHSNGLVYGDLKPSNVFIGGSEQV